MSEKLYLTKTLSCFTISAALFYIFTFGPLSLANGDENCIEYTNFDRITCEDIMPAVNLAGTIVSGLLFALPLAPELAKVLDTSKGARFRGGAFIDGVPVILFEDEKSQQDEV